MEGAQFFRYRKGTTFLHKLNPSVKIFLMLVLAIGAFYVPVVLAFVLWFALILFSILFLHFSFQEIFADLKPVIIYAIFISIVAIIAKNFSYYINLFIHLALSLEVSSLFYRTTSPTEFKTGFANIERFFTRKETAPLSETLSLTITFIPRIANFWNKLCIAWKNRDGKNSLKKIVSLVPCLFTLSMKEGSKKSDALQMRD